MHLHPSFEADFFTSRDSLTLERPMIRDTGLQPREPTPHPEFVRPRQTLLSLRMCFRDVHGIPQPHSVEVSVEHQPTPSWERVAPPCEEGSRHKVQDGLAASALALPCQQD